MTRINGYIDLFASHSILPLPIQTFVFGGF